MSWDAVSDTNLVTASGIAPLEFTMEVLKNRCIYTRYVTFMV